jgi:hypothetical protein
VCTHCVLHVLKLPFCRGNAAENVGCSFFGAGGENLELCVHTVCCMFQNCIFVGGNAAENVGCSFFGLGMIIWSCVYTLCVACSQIAFLQGEMLQKMLAVHFWGLE